MSEYVIRGGIDGKRRLDLLARELRPTTVEWLARAGVGPGMRCLDLGCGGGHVTAELARAAGPDGSVVGIDSDGVFCRPVSPAFERYRSIFMTLMRQRGGDPTIGPRLAGLLRGAGLGDPELRVVHPVHYRGEGKLGNYITMVNIADRAVADGLLAGQEAEGLLTELLTVSEDEDTVIGWPRIFQVAARRPAA